MNNSPNVEKAIKEVIEELKSMDSETFRRELDKTLEKYKEELDINSIEFLRQT